LTTRYGRRPIPTGPIHPRGCHCPNCDRVSRAEYEAAQLQEAAARREAAKLQTRQQVREEMKAARVREVLEAETRVASRAVGDLREAKARADADPKAERLRVLRAEGRTLAEAIEIIESEDHADRSSNLG
jgi:hypothetical protein